MDNVEITVPKGKTLEFIICDYGTIKDYDNVVLKEYYDQGRWAGKLYFRRVDSCKFD